MNAPVFAYFGLHAKYCSRRQEREQMTEVVASRFRVYVQLPTATFAVVALVVELVILIYAYKHISYGVVPYRSIATP